MSWPALRRMWQERYQHRGPGRRRRGRRRRREKARYRARRGRGSPGRADHRRYRRGRHGGDCRRGRGHATAAARRRDTTEHRGPFRAQRVGRGRRRPPPLRRPGSRPPGRGRAPGYRGAPGVADCSPAPHPRRGGGDPVTRPLVILAIVAAIAAAILLKVIISVLRHVIRKHGAYLILWYVTRHHNGGKRACCEKHCTPAVRWRRARFRLSPLVLAIATVTMLAAGLAWLLAVPAGILAGIIVLYPRRAGRVGRVLATPVTKRVSIPAPTLALRPAARLSASAQHQREVVRPMAAALAPVLEM